MQVPFSRSSLNHDDIFILDTKNKIYQFNGANSNIQERGKALEVVQFLKDKYHEGTCDAAIVGKNRSSILHFSRLYLCVCDDESPLIVCTPCLQMMEN